MNEGPTVEQDGQVIRIPMSFKRRGGRKEIIVPEGLPATPRSKSPTQEPLVVALGRAHHWQELIDSGRYATITDLAAALEVDRAYASRMLRLTLLAPDIIEAILRGAEPSGLSLARLTGRLPLLWTEQRERFGFPAR
jgi:hypothetical protein